MRGALLLMFRIFWRTQLMRTSMFFAVSVLLAAVAPLKAEYLWTDGFETYLPGSIDGKDTTWDVVDATAMGNVVSSPVYGGSQALEVGSYAKSWVWWDLVKWDNDVDPKWGGLVELSWWMYTKHYEDDSCNHQWMIEVEGWHKNGDQVVTRPICELTTREGTSNTWVDAKTSGGVWKETEAIIHNETWKHVFLQIDFDASPEDQYWVRVGDSGDWCGPYSLGEDTQYLRSLKFWCLQVGAAQFYFDDFAIVPEPATFLNLLSMGAVLLVAYACQRRKRPA